MDSKLLLLTAFLVLVVCSSFQNAEAKNVVEGKVADVDIEGISKMDAARVRGKRDDDDDVDSSSSGSSSSGSSSSGSSSSGSSSSGSRSSSSSSIRSSSVSGKTSSEDDAEP